MSDKQDADTSKTLSPAEEIIEGFGGIRSMAHKLDVAVSTVQGWKQRKHIPEGREEAIRKAAKAHEVKLDDGVLKRAIAGESAAAAKASSGPTKTEAAAREAPEKAAPQKSAAQQRPAQQRPAQQTSSEEKATGKEKASAEGARPQQTESKPSPAAESKPWPEPSPPAAQAEPPQPAERGGGSFLSGMILGAVILGVGVAGAFVTRGQWLPLVDGDAAGQTQAVGDLSARLDVLERQSAEAQELERLRETVGQLSDRVERLAEADGDGAAAELAGSVEQLNRRVDDLAAAVEAAPGAEMEQDLADLAKRIGDLGGQVSSLSESAADAERVNALSGRLDELAMQIASVEESVSGLGSQVEELGANRRQLARNTAADVAVALAIGELREALRLGRGFAAELAALNGLLPPDSPLMTHTGALSPYAESGVPTRAALAQRFEAIAADVVAAAAGGDREDWVGDVLNRLGGVVSVRPVGGEVSGDDVGAVVARAEAALGAGDLETAEALVTKLTGEPAGIAADWLKSARARLAAEKALSSLTVQAMETLGGRVAGTEG